VAAVLALLFSPHYPWYYGWLLMLLCFARPIPLLLSVTAACGFFLAALTYGMVFGIPDHMLDFNVVLFVPLGVLVLADFWLPFAKTEHSTRILDPVAVGLTDDTPARAAARPAEEG
jgi:hypothetical protein